MKYVVKQLKKRQNERRQTVDYRAKIKKKKKLMKTTKRKAMKIASLSKPKPSTHACTSGGT